MRLNCNFYKKKLFRRSVEKFDGTIQQPVLLNSFSLGTLAQYLYVNKNVGKKEINVEFSLMYS